MSSHSNNGASNRRSRTSLLEFRIDADSSQYSHEEDEEESSSSPSLSEEQPSSSFRAGTGRGDDNNDISSESVDIDGDSYSFNGDSDSDSVDTTDEEEFNGSCSEADEQAMLAAFMFAQQMYQHMHMHENISDDDDDGDDTDNIAVSLEESISIYTRSSRSDSFDSVEEDEFYMYHDYDYNTTGDDSTLRDAILLVLSSDTDREQTWICIRNFITSADGSSQSQLLTSYDYWEPMGTLLHIICYHDPPSDIVEALMQIRDEEGNLCGPEEMCRYGNEDEDTPLHIACRHNASIDVLQLLASGHIYSLYSQNDSCNRPIDELCRRLCEMCMISDPDLVNIAAMKNDLSPCLDKAFRMYNNNNNNNSGDEDALFGKNVNNLLTQAEILVQMSSAEDRGEPAMSMSTLHAAICTYCPLPILLLLLKFRPEHASMRDSSGRVPLLAFFEESDCSNDFGDNDSSSVSSELCQYFVDILIGANPNAARMSDDKGRIALNVAVSYGWPYEVLRKILDCAPRALVTRDVPSGLYPFMLAATSYAYGDNKVCTTYRLLREEPLLMSGLQDDPPWLKVKKIKDENEVLKLENKNLKSDVDSLTDQVRKLKMEIASFHSYDGDRIGHVDNQFYCVTPEK